jgi:hypothetical protein
MRSSIFTRFTRKKVQMLTQKARLELSEAALLLLSLLALLVQKCKY